MTLFASKFSIHPLDLSEIYQNVETIVVMNMKLVSRVFIPWELLGLQMPQNLGLLAHKFSCSAQLKC